MGLFDIFRKNKQDDGTFRREYGGEEARYQDYAAFRLTVQDVFMITGRGCVVTGQVEAGTVTVGDSVTLRRTDGSSREVTVTGIEMFRKMLDRAVQGDNVGLLLRGMDRNEVGRGDVLEKAW